MIPPFDERGNLPPGIHKADWTELEAAFGGSPRRVALLAGLREALASLRRAGCRTAYIDGSFVTAKEEPGDFDACWDAVGKALGQPLWRLWGGYRNSLPVISIGGYYGTGSCRNAKCSDCSRCGRDGISIGAFRHDRSPSA